MILPKVPEYSDQDDSAGQSGISTAGPSEPPPSFAEATSDQLVESQSGGEAPPPFTPYFPEASQTGWHGSIVSHDTHLNQDGEALFRFLLSQSMTRPQFRLHIIGTHEERRSRTTRKHGKLENEEYTETVTDFNFTIDIGQFLLPTDSAGGPIYWSAADNEPCYRGSMIRQTTSPWGKHQKSRRKENKAFERWTKDNRRRGIPPWVAGAYAWRGRTPEEEESGAGTLRSSRTIRDWADEYCASEKIMKEFVFEKIVCGWDLSTLETVIRDTIRNTLYQGDLSVHFETHKAKVYVRPDNRLSRFLSNGWLKLLSIILLIYPFIWLFKRFHSKGGGQWEVCGACYFMKRWVPVEADDDDFAAIRDDKSFAASPVGTYHSSRRFIRTSDGFSKLVGLRESEWYKDWQKTITRAVREGRQVQDPIRYPVDTAPRTAAWLE